MFTYFFQGNVENSDETIGIKRAIPLFAVSVLLVVFLLVLYRRTFMIGTDRAADDEEVLVILRNMKNAVGHFAGDKKNI